MARTIVACKIFKDLFEEYLNPDDEIVYFEIEQHLEISVLHQQLQQTIDESNNYEIILLYGICGNATAGLQSKNHLVKILRVHDCTAVLMGGNSQFLAEFSDNLSQGWSSVNYHSYSKAGKSIVLNDNRGLLKTKQQYIEKYGEDNGEYLWALLKTDNRIAYFTFHTAADEQTIADIKAIGKYEIIKTITATKELLRRALIRGEDLFILEENRVLVPTYDFDEVFRSK